MDLENLIEAYYLCRANKRDTEGALSFEVDYESELVDLCDEVNARTYHLSTSRAFIVARPVYREVFAPAFRDRIIDTYLAVRIERILETVFTNRTFNCRKDKGALYGVRMLYNDILMCSNDYTSDCYILKVDIKGFFMSIPKALLADRVDDFIKEMYNGDDLNDMLYLCRTAITHCPELDCERRSPNWMWNHVAPNKSLFTNGEGRGMAIGRIIVQVFANFFLDRLDHWIEDELGFQFHGRYVDDVYIVYHEKQRLLESIPLIRKKLSEDFMLELHPNKVYIQHYTKGVKFTGSVIKPGRVYIGNRTLAGLRRTIYKFNKLNPDIEDACSARKLVASLNSYYGLMCHASTYAIRRKYASMLKPQCWKYFYISGSFKKFVLKKKYTEQQEILNQVLSENNKNKKVYARQKLLAGRKRKGNKRNKR